MLICDLVCLRYPTDADIETIHQWKNDLELLNLIMAKPLPATLNETKEWLDKNIKDKNQVILGIYTLQDKDNKSIQKENYNILVGIARLMFIDWINRKAELGIYIANENFRGKGIGKASSKLIIDYAFLFLNLHKVYLQVAESNTSAIELYKSIGFKVEEIKREEFWNKNKYENILIMGILDHEYFGKI